MRLPITNLFVDNCKKYFEAMNFYIALNTNLLTHMKILKNILIGLLTIIVLLLVVSFFLPSKVHVERSTTIGASPEVVFSHIQNLKKWNTWSPWAKKDSTMTNTYDGPDGEVGQKSIWTSEKVGNGSMTITEIIPNEKLVTKLMFEGSDGGTGTLLLEKTGDSTKVTWSMDANTENTSAIKKPMSKYFFLFFDNMVGDDFKEGLQGLKELAESTPVETKPNYEVQEITTEAQIVMAAPKQRLKLEELPAYFAKYFGELYGAALQNNVKPSHTMAMYYFWDGKETEVEALLPIDKEPITDAGFKVRELPATKAIKIDYYGPYEGLAQPHEALDAYAKDKGLALGYPWEAYITDPSTEPDTSKWLTQVYYPIMEGDATAENVQ